MPPSWALHPPGTQVRVVTGTNAGKEGKIGADGFCSSNRRYLVVLDGEEWYVPRGDLISMVEPKCGSRVVVQRGKNLGRTGVVAGKHEVHNLHHIVLDATDQHPPKAYVIQRDPAGEWPISFGEGDKRRTVASSSSAAEKAGVKTGMVVASLNGDTEWGSLDSATGDELVLQKQDGWWLHREMFDCFTE